MCFSATASFTSAGVLGAAGVASWRSVRREPDRAYAVLPLIFAAHQLVEGFVWLSLEGKIDPRWTPTFGGAFALVAFIFWPTYVPVAILQMETHRWRRQVAWASAAMGTLTSVAFLWVFWRKGIGTAILGSSIAYALDYEPKLFWNVLYGAAVCFPCWASKYFWVRAFGVALAVSYQIAYRGFTDTHESVWCYFAALLSVMVILHLRRFPPESPALRT